MDEHFDPAQKEYFIYRFGLKDLIPKKLKKAAEHFHFPVSYVKKIEAEGLRTLNKKL